MQRSIFVFPALLSACLIVTGASRAEEAAPTEAEQMSLPWYDQAQAGMSGWLVNTAARMDSFFGDQRALEEDYADTYMRVRMGITQSRINHTEWTSQVYAKMPLHQLGRRLNIFVTGGEEEQNISSTPIDTVRNTEKSAAAGVQYVLDETRESHWSLGGSLGALRNVTPSVNLRYRYFQPLGNRWFVRYTQKLYWDQDRKEGVMLRGDLERVMGPRTLLRFSTDADYWNNESGASWNAGAALLHRLSDRAALAFDLGASGVSRPEWEPTTYRTGVRYRRNFFRSWLFYEIEPALRWTQDPLNTTDTMTFDPAITLRLEVQFGKAGGL